MKITKYQNDDERAAITGMIVSDRVLGRIHSRLKSERKPFRSRWANIVLGWCIAYFTKYQKAPRGAIVGEFRQWAKKSKDEEATKTIEQLLSGLSADHARAAKELNEEWVIDAAARHFNEVHLERLNKSVEGAPPNEAQEKIAAYRPINLSTSSLIWWFKDREFVFSSYDREAADVLVHYPKDLGKFFGSHLRRGGFIAFMAPEKTGKSFWLIDLAWRAAVRDNRRTLFYSVGDMTDSQVNERLMVRTAKRPRWAEEIKYPLDIQPGRKKNKTVVLTEDRNYTKPLSKAEMGKALDQRSTALLGIQCVPNSSMSVADIQADITGLIHEGWVPDVVVIDYADILAPEPGTSGQDYRHQINVTWQALRRLSQQNHILVVTATQSSASSYGAHILRREHFSEDKRKYSHVTGLIGINQDHPEEKDEGIFRLNWIVLREGSYSDSRCVHVAGCLAIANPAIVSAW
jgi:hypothetical protein